MSDSRSDRAKVDKNDQSSPRSGFKLGNPPLPIEGESSYRGDGRDPSLVFKKGFKARGNDMDLLSHVFPPEKFSSSYSSHESAYISTSLSKEVAVGFPYNVRPGTQQSYVYEIQVRKPTIDVASELMSSGELGPVDLDLLKMEKERAVPFRIKSNEVKGGWRVDITETSALTPEELVLLNSKEAIKTTVNGHLRIMQDEFIQNPKYPSYAISRYWNIAKVAGRVLTGIGLYLDASSLSSEYKKSSESGDYHNTYKEGARIAAGWSGAYAVGSAGLKLGVVGCAPFTPYGSAICGLVGGLVGSVVGYQAGSKITTRLYNDTKELTQVEIVTDRLSESAISSPKKQVMGNNNYMFRLFESSGEKEKRIDEEFKQREIQLEENYKKEREKEEDKRIELRDRVISDPKITEHMSAIASTAIKKSSSHRRPLKNIKKLVPISDAPIEDKAVSRTPTAEDKQTAEFLIGYGSKPNEVVQLFQDPSTWDMAKEAVKQYELQQKKLELQQNHVNCMEFFNGMGSIFTAFSQCDNRLLRKVGSIGLPLMMGGANLETLTGVFSGGAGTLVTKGFWGSFSAIGGFIGVGICLINQLLSGGNEDEQRQLMESLQQIHHHIDTVRREMHERFDHIESVLAQIAGMMASYCNQIIQNQKALFELNRHHIELSLNGFRSITTLLGDFRAESKSDHEKIFKQFSYLVGLTETERLQKLRRSIKSKVKIITEMSKEITLSDRSKCFDLRKDLIKLESDLEDCASAFYNGGDNFALINRDPAQSAKFLAQRLLSHDDALGFLAEEIENLDEKPLTQARIKKEKLPVTALWSSTMHHYITLSRLPIFSEYKATGMLQEINDQSENLSRFLQYIKTSGVVEKCLARHKQYLDEFQQTLYQVFIYQQKTKPGLGIKDKKEDESRERKLTVGDYRSSGAAKAATEEILNLIDYNYLLLNRLVYLGGYSREFQQEIAQLDRSITLLEQSFNFNEIAVSAYAGHLSDESMPASSSYIHDTPYQNSHLETIGAHLYGTSGNKQLIFSGSYCYSEDQPGAAEACSLSINRYELSTMSSKNISTINSSVTPTKPFPLIKYKGNFKVTVNHTWASSHIINDRFVLYTGGSGYVVLFNLSTGKSELVDTSQNPLTFSVPVPKDRVQQGQAVPNTTCYTHVLNDRYLHITKLKWQILGHPEVDFQAIDLEDKKPLQSYEVIRLFRTWDWGSHTLKSPSEYMPISPSQFFINTIRPAGKNEAMVYGLVQSTHPYKYILRLTNEHHLESEQLGPDTIAVILNDGPYKELKAFWMVGNKLESKSFHESNVKEIIQALPEVSEILGFILPTYDPELASKIVLKYNCPRPELSASFYYKPITDRGEQPKDYKDMKASGFGIYHFPIAAKTIHQTRSQVLYTDGTNKLFIPVLITDEDDHSKLVMLSADFFNTSTRRSLIEAKTFDMPTLHPTSDWQAMQTTVAKIGDRDHLIITALNPDYKMLIFSYDPKLKKLTQLMDGPQLQFPEYEKNTNPQTRITYRGFEGLDRYLLKARKKYPGFYPVRSIEIRVSEVNGINTLHIAYPTMEYPWGTTYHIRVASMPLSPILSLKPIPAVPDQPAPALPASESPPPELPANHLAVALYQTRLLLSLPEEIQPTRSSDAKQELKSEPTLDVLQPIINSCKSIHELFSDTLTELKLTHVKEKLVNDKLQRIEDTLGVLENSYQTEDDFLQKTKEVYKMINTIDGLLKSNPAYISGIGKNMDRSIDQLKSEIDTIERQARKETRSITPLASNSLFSAPRTSGETITSRVELGQPRSNGSTLISLQPIREQSLAGLGKH